MRGIALLPMHAAQQAQNWQMPNVILAAVVVAVVLYAVIKLTSK